MQAQTGIYDDIQLQQIIIPGVAIRPTYIILSAFSEARRLTLV